MAFDGQLDEFRLSLTAEFDVPHENDIFLKLTILAQMLFKMPKVAFGVKYPESVYKPQYSFFANYADNWVDTFLNRSPAYHGSTCAQGKRRRPIDERLNRPIWDPEDFEGEREFFGVRFDWRRVIPGPRGTLIELGFGRHESEAPVHPTAEIDVLVSCFLDAIMPLLVKKNQPHHDVVLTAQARIVLSMVLDGFDFDLIAGFMGISVSRVKKISEDARELLDRDSAILAAAYANRLGLLDRNAYEFDKLLLRETQ